MENEGGRDIEDQQFFWPVGGDALPLAERLVERTRTPPFHSGPNPAKRALPPSPSKPSAKPRCEAGHPPAQEPSWGPVPSLPLAAQVSPTFAAPARASVAAHCVRTVQYKGCVWSGQRTTHTQTLSTIAITVPAESYDARDHGNCTQCMYGVVLCHLAFLVLHGVNQQSSCSPSQRKKECDEGRLAGGG